MKILDLRENTAPQSAAPNVIDIRGQKYQLVPISAQAPNAAHTHKPRFTETPEWASLTARYYEVKKAMNDFKATWKAPKAAHTPTPATAFPSGTPTYDQLIQRESPNSPAPKAHKRGSKKAAPVAALPASTTPIAEVRKGLEAMGTFSEQEITNFCTRVTEEASKRKK